MLHPGKSHLKPCGALPIRRFGVRRGKFGAAEIVGDVGVVLGPAGDGEDGGCSRKSAGSGPAWVRNYEMACLPNCEITLPC
jgi:hypothetical protein